MYHAVCKIKARIHAALRSPGEKKGSAWTMFQGRNYPYLRYLLPKQLNHGEQGFPSPGLSAAVAKQVQVISNRCIPLPESNQTGGPLAS